MVVLDGEVLPASLDDNRSASLFEDRSAELQ
jgi:hypothetical protein